MPRVENPLAVYLNQPNYLVLHQYAEAVPLLEIVPRIGAADIGLLCGSDLPDASCIVIARPTMSLALY